MGFRKVAAAGALALGLMGVAAPASAAPVGPATLGAGETGSPVEPAQFGFYGPGYGYGYGYGRPFYGPPPGYYRRRFYGPPVVCRFRPTPWGPRRVCFRRY